MIRSPLPQGPSSRPGRLSFVLTASALATLSGSASAGVVSWLNPVSGFWDLGANWDGGAIPASADFAEIDIAGAYTVTVRTNPSVRGLRLTNPDALLHIENARILSIVPQIGDASADLVNNAVILVNSNQGISNTAVVIGNATAPGVLRAEEGSTGEVVLNVAQGNPDVTDARLTINNDGLHASNHVVRGTGQVTGQFTNEGLILADRDYGELRISAVVTQPASGVVGATDDGTLSLTGGLIRGGQITADEGARIALTAGTGAIEGGAVLSGRLDVLNVFTLDIGPGGLVNNGEILVNSNQGISTTRVLVNTDASILGTGSINLNVADGNPDLPDAQLTTAAAVTATNGPDHAVRGKGQVMGSWINEGLIRANRAGQELRITAQVVQAPGGVVDAIDDAVLGIASGGRVVGGTISSSDTARFAVTLGTGTIEGGAHLTGLGGINNTATLEIGPGGIVNDSEILVNSNQGISTTRVLVNTDATILGTGSINLNVANGNSDLPDALLSTAEGVTATNGPDHTVRGKGQVMGSWINAGLVRADRDGQELRITGHIVQDPGGVIGATGTAVLGIASGGRVTGGSVITEDDGIVETTSGTGTVDGALHNLGSMGVRNAATLEIGAGGIVNDGEILVNTNQSTSTTRVLVSTDAGILGSGSINLNVANANIDLPDAQLVTAEGVTATNGPDHTVRGKGRVSGSWINRGTIGADRAGQDLELIGDIEQPDAGTIRADHAGFIRLNAVTITGGFFDSADAGAVHAAGAGNFVSGVTNLGHLGVRNAGRIDILAGGLTNHGVLTVNTAQSTSTTTLIAAEDATIDGDGEIVLNVSAGNNDYTDAQIGAQSDAVLTIAQGQTIVGKGRLFGRVVLGGAIAPGFGVGTIRVEPSGTTNALTMTPSALYDAELAGPTTHDRVTATVPVALDGTLRVTPIDAFEPAYPSGYTLATSSALTGRFHTVDYQATLPPGAVARVIYTSTEAVFAITCPADLALPVGLLDLSDITAFITAFSAQDPAADLAAPFGLFDLNDVVAFVTSFGAGCP